MDSLDHINKQGPNASFKTGIFWNQSRWNGLKSIPVILELQGTILILKTKKEEVFRVPIATVSVKFDRWGTMRVLVNGISYAFFGSGPDLSRSFSEEQLNELQQDQNDSGNPEPNIAHSTGTLRETLATAPFGARFFTGKEVIDLWQPIFKQASVPFIAQKFILTRRNFSY